MKKIIVPTDFSINSKAGVRFAIHWASQQNLELVFVHVHHILRATRWSDDYFEEYAAEEQKMCLIKFKKFIGKIYWQLKIEPGTHSFVIIQGISADISIMDYCRENKGIDCICIGTRGAGAFKKIFGTNTGNLITKSDVPVLAVPENYRGKEFKTIMYAADLRNYSNEIKKVIDFAEPLEAKIDVVHFSWPDEVMFDEEIIEAATKGSYKFGLKLHFEKNDAVHSLIDNLQNQIKKSRPSIVVMFTNQKRTLYQRIFLSSKSEELSFHLKVPLLVFNKN